MSTKGDLIAEYVIQKIDIVTNEYKLEVANKAPDKELIDTFKDKWQEAVATGIDEYLTNEFYYDVKTNGAVVIATTPPGSYPIVNYGVDGTFQTLGADLLKTNFNANLQSTTIDAIINMAGFFQSILSWLPIATPFLAVTGSITAVDINPIVYLSTVAGPLTTLVWTNFIPLVLAQACINETSVIEFVDNEGKQTGKNYTDVWKIIGKYIYQGLENNVATFTPVAGTADASKIPNGTTYTAVTTLGVIKFN